MDKRMEQKNENDPISCKYNIKPIKRKIECSEAKHNDCDDECNEFNKNLMTNGEGVFCYDKELLPIPLKKQCPEESVTRCLRSRSKLLQNEDFKSAKKNKSKCDSKLINMEENGLTRKRSHSLMEKDNSTPEMPIASLGLLKLNYEINIDPDVEDVYTDKTVKVLSDENASELESPETKRKRIEKENLVVARQCRLHPANQKYNQGPVENPPLISPGTMVGYTPAGQRHEVDLNFERPTHFNSEYARMQFDDATKINVSRMFHDLQNGIFLPSNLDANIERRYFAEQNIITRQAKEHFDKCLNDSEHQKSVVTDAEDFDEHMGLLDVERSLIDLVEFAAVRGQDFPADLSRRLQYALTYKLTPLMFMKNPIILETIEELTTLAFPSDVKRVARELLNKIKGLFSVPQSSTFQEYFLAEVKRLKEKTENMSAFDFFMMTTEPPLEEKEESVVGDGDLLWSSVSQAILDTEQHETNTTPNPAQPNQTEDGWLPVLDGIEPWLSDVQSCVEIDNRLHPSETNESESYGFSDSDEASEYTVDSDDDDDDDDRFTLIFEDNEASEDEDDADTLSDMLHGMLIQGLPRNVVINYFEYI